MTKYNRRDLLKLATAIPSALALSRLLPANLVSNCQAGGTPPNIILLVFDTVSASHLSLYNYPRKTTPNLEQLAKHANVYFSHCAEANFTVPGTASIFTGLHPWTHRALQLSGLIARDLTGQNIFRSLGRDYYRFAFSQNVWAANLLNQFEGDLDRFLPPGSFGELSMLVSEAFPNDANTAHQADDNLLFEFVDPPASLLFGLPHRIYFERKKKKMFDRDFPRGIPQPRNYPVSYKLSNVFDGVLKSISDLPHPFFSYIHIFSPHAPYRARKDFIGIFNDGWTHIRKPDSVFTEEETYETIEQNRVWYDEYIANVDHEIGRLMNGLKQQGILDNSYIFITSDHGELLERGIKGHITPALYEPLTCVPLIVSAPGQKDGKAIHAPTSSVDLLPTILNLTGHEVPAWVEGKLLPGLGGIEEADRPIYMLEAKSSPALGKLQRASFAMRQGKYKMIMYHGYEQFGQDAFELYDLENDPEEMDDLFGKQPHMAGDLKAQLAGKFNEINKPIAG